MEGESDPQGASGAGSGKNPTPEGARPGPAWRAWVISILAAIVISLAATLMLGDASSFRHWKCVMTGGSECCGSDCGEPGK